MNNTDFIFTDFSEVRKYFPDAADNSFENILPFLRRGLKKLLRIVPTEIYQMALDHYIDSISDDEDEENDPVENPTPDEEPAESPDLDKLVQLIQECIALYGVFKKTPLSNAIFSENGLVQQWSDSFRPLRAEDAEKYKNEVLFLFHESVEFLIEFLNASNIEAWDESKQKKLSQATLFTDASVFSDFVSIDNSVRFFHLLIPDIVNAQKELINEIGDRFETLKSAVYDDTVPPDDEEFLKQCQYFLAFRAMTSSCIKISSDDFPSSLRAIVTDNESRDSNSASFARQGYDKLKLISALNRPPSPDPLPPATPVNKSKKEFSL